MRGLQTSVRNNSTAYGYSLTVTATLGVLAAELDAPTVGQVFLFAAGAVMGVVAVEAAATRGFRERARSEPPQVVVFGSALAILSVGSAVGAGALAAVVLGTGVAWPIGGLLASLLYLLAAGAEMAMAERASRPKRGG